MRTSKARNKIKSFLRTEQRAESQRLGKELLNYELNKVALDIDKVVSSKKIELLIKASRESTAESLFAAAGYGKINVKDLIQKVFPQNPSSLRLHLWKKWKSLKKKLLFKPSQKMEWLSLESKMFLFPSLDVVTHYLEKVLLDLLREVVEYQFIEPIVLEH